MKRGMLKRLAAAAVIEEYPKGHVICRQHERCDRLYLLLSGRCTQVRLEHDHPGLTSALLPGDVVGRREVLTDAVYRATVTVASHAVFLVIPAIRLAQELREGSRILGAFSQPELGTPMLAEERLRRRLVAFGRANPQAPLASEVASSLADVTCREVLLLEIVAGEGGQPSLSDWLRCRSRQDRFCFADHVENHGAWKRVRLHWSPQANNPSHIADLFGHLHRFFPYVIVDLDLEEPVAAHGSFLGQADLAFLYPSADGQGIGQMNQLIAEANRLSPTNPTHWVPVLRRGSASDAWSFEDLGQQLGLPASSFQTYAEGPGHLRSLARTIAGRRVGLALSAGAAKGLAHIGVIQVLEENGIEVDAVVGTSMGAYVGACWCAGHDGTSLAALAASIQGVKGLMSLADPLFPPRVAFFRGDKAERRLAESIRQARFEDLSRPLHIVATDLGNLGMKVFSSGPVAPAAHASFAMPGVMAPVEINGRRYTDGAACNPLPVDVLENLGIERVIAVNTLPSLDDLSLGLNITNPKPNGWWRKAGAMINQKVNYFAPGNVLDTVMNAHEASQTRLCEFAAQRADVFINAYPTGAAWYSFDQHSRCIQVGREAAQHHLESLRKLMEAPALS